MTQPKAPPWFQYGPEEREPLHELISVILVMLHKVQSGVGCSTGKGLDHVPSFPLRRTNVITLWVWNMHECLQQFKHWLKCKIDDVFWAAWCLRVFDRKCSQHGDWVYLAPLRSRWVRLLGRRCCDSIGTIKAICEQLTTPHWLWVYSGPQHM